MRRIALLCLTLPLLCLALTVPAAAQPAPIEDYAPYQPATKCRPHAKPGAVLLQRFIVARFGGAPGRIGARCDGTVSEHHEGRAIDWMVDARTARGRAAADRLFTWLFATDHAGDEDARARRLGVMYVIWDDHIYSSYRGFEAEKYRNAACRGKKLKRCSPTLRHRDHVHLSLTRAGGKGLTSWFVGRL
ncbi:hypothetical protein GCM10022215_28420 [Nocardioides fonticola]|uniref:ARB-07466-like C-terminal domain-containing protein n=1 Tax=Nocardioides fonticola TaxID=450363 RepID=A0ABP7XNE7_9ACTN